MNCSEADGTLRRILPRVDQAHAAAPADTTAHPIPEVGALVLDTGADKVGEYRSAGARGWLLRPPGGGSWWYADPGDVRPAGVMERLRAGAAMANERSRQDRERSW